MAREIDKIVQQLQHSIEEDTYSQIETDKIEIKSLADGNDWKELYKTVCAFLNTRGGIVIIGVKEQKNKKFVFRGYDPNTEPKLKLIPTLFKDDEGRPINLSDYIRVDLIEVVPFLGGQICLLFVEKLPDEYKYVFYEGEAFERQITGDKRIDSEKIEAQIQLKNELANARELQLVANSTIDDLDIDKLNDYILRLNKDVKVETLKPDIANAKSFLTRKKFIRENNPTLLGMLVCGKHLYDFVSGRCEVDCYSHSGGQIAEDKKILKDNIIGLMESSIAYVFNKTGTGISVDKGGSTLYEYPERIIRETVNNALAHRDYSIDKFIIITIVANKHIEIRNPGRFKREQILLLNDDINNKRIDVKRIIPIPKAQNPNLADVLKSYDRWEGRGLGMSSLTNFALNNRIDIPYYRIYANDDIGLFVQKGKVFDEEMEIWLNGFSKYILHKTSGRDLKDEEKTVLSYLYKSELLNRSELYTISLTPDNNHFEVIRDLEEMGLILRLSSSPELYPTYVVDRVLTKREFSTELRLIFGGAYDSLNNNLKSILESIYQHNEFSLATVISASLIGNYLYLRDNKNVIDIKAFDAFKRKVRSAINKLEKAGFITRKSEGKPNYEINTNYKRVNSIFDN